jgi:hypothetical protein
LGQTESKDLRLFFNEFQLAEVDKIARQVNVDLAARKRQRNQRPLRMRQQAARPFVAPERTQFGKSLAGKHGGCSQDA